MRKTTSDEHIHSIVPFQSVISQPSVWESCGTGRTNLIVFEIATPITMRALNRQRFHVIGEAAIRHDLRERG